MSSKKIRDLFIGKDHHITSWSDYRRIILTGYLSLLGLAVALFYIVFDYFEGHPESFIYYSIYVLTAIVSLFLIRGGQYNLARFILLLSALVVISIFASVEPVETGIDLFYVILCMASLTLFDFKRIYLGIILCLLAIAVFLFLHITGYQLIDETTIYDESIRTVFLTNFIICTVSAVLIMYFIISTGYYTEKEMQKTELSLMQITDELADSRKRFELAIRGSSAGIWDWNLKDNTLYISPQMMRMLGHEPKERTEIPYDEFMSYLHPDDKILIKRKVSHHLKREGKFEVECRIRKKDGDYIWVLDTGQAEWDADGNEQRMVGSIVDITERKEAERQLNEKNLMLKKTNEELDRFVYSTSHDLRAPLSSVVGLINLAQTTSDQDELQKCLVLMKDRINTLNNFIADIISYSRNSRLDVAYEKTSLSDIIDHIFTNLEYFERQKDIRIEQHFDADFELNTDKSRLRIILNNLITNAIKYHNLEQSDPFIKVAAFKSNGHVTIAVEDNGHGIEDEFQHKVFDMFYRASVNSEGSGLGLYIAREMAEKLKGNIDVQSSFGKGSTFTLTLPLN